MATCFFINSGNAFRSCSFASFFEVLRGRTWRQRKEEKTHKGIKNGTSMLKRRKINENDKFTRHKNERMLPCLLFQYLMKEEEKIVCEGAHCTSKFNDALSAYSSWILPRESECEFEVNKSTKRDFHSFSLLIKMILTRCLRLRVASVRGKFFPPLTSVEVVRQPWAFRRKLMKINCG